MAAGGYPADYRKGLPILGLPTSEWPNSDTKVFHAGTALNEQGEVVTNGGRVLCVCALGESVGAAQRRAYAEVERIHWEDAYYRHDIGYRAIAREAGSS